MRLWSLHPEHLDGRGLVAVWREALLARAVLAGATRGYLNHPQLARFKAHPAPLDAIEAYLAAVLADAIARGYAFDAGKLASIEAAPAIVLSEGQLEYEARHLAAKLAARSPRDYARFAASRAAGDVRPHPSFRLVPGAVAVWERT